MTIVTLLRGDDITQRVFQWAHEARTWLILSGYLLEDSRYEFTHPYTGWTAKIEVSK